MLGELGCALELAASAVQHLPCGIGYGARVRLRTLVSVTTLTLALVAGVLAASAFASTTFTWSGTDTSTNWSLADNWTADDAPSAGDTGDLLDFPATLSGGDCETTQNDACYVAEDDIHGYSVSGITLDDGGTDDYYLQGDADNDALELGSDGVTATTASSMAGGAEIGFPIELTAPQEWSIDGGPAEQGQLVLDDGLTAASTSADNLTVALVSSGLLSLSGDNEVGPTTVEGDGGSVSLDGAELDSGDGQSVTVDDGAGLLGTGIVGPLSVSDGVISPGNPAGTVAVDGSASFEGKSVFEPLIGGASGTDSSELTASGNISLGTDTYLEIESTSADDSCPTLNFGATYTLISATGSISGTFNGAPNSGDSIPMDCTGAVDPQLTIDYNTNSSPETVTATVSGPPTPTTTTLTSNETWQAGATATLTATVSAASGAPSGMVLFEREVPNYNGIAGFTAYFEFGCPSATVGPGDETVTCTFVNGSDGGILYVAKFFPTSDAQFDASISSVLSGDVMGSPPLSSGNPLALTQLTYLTHVEGKGVLLKMNCESAGSSAACSTDLSLTVVEKIRGGKLVSVATLASKQKTKEKTVVIGSASTAVADATSSDYLLELNATGKALLKRFGHLTAELSVIANGVTFAGSAVPFRESSAHAPRGRRVRAPIRRGTYAPPGTAQLDSSARSDWRGERLVARAAVGS